MLRGSCSERAIFCVVRVVELEGKLERVHLHVGGEHIGVEARSELGRFARGPELFGLEVGHVGYARHLEQEVIAARHAHVALASIVDDGDVDALARLDHLEVGAHRVPPCVRLLLLVRDAALRRVLDEHAVRRGHGVAATQEAQTLFVGAHETHGVLLRCGSVALAD